MKTREMSVSECKGHLSCFVLAGKIVCYDKLLAVLMHGSGGMAMATATWRRSCYSVL